MKSHKQLLVLFLIFIPSIIFSQQIVKKSINALRKQMVKEYLCKDVIKESGVKALQKRVGISLEKALYKARVSESTVFVSRKYRTYVEYIKRMSIKGDIEIHITASEKLKNEVLLLKNQFEKHPFFKDVKVIWDNKKCCDIPTYNSYYIKIIDIDELRNDKVWNLNVHTSNRDINKFFENNDNAIFQAVSPTKKLGYYTRIIVK